MTVTASVSQSVLFSMPACPERVLSTTTLNVCLQRESGHVIVTVNNRINSSKQLSSNSLNKMYHTLGQHTTPPACFGCRCRRSTC